MGPDIAFPPGGVAMWTKTRTLPLGVLTVAAVLALAGCSHYWERPGGAVTDFERESGACIEDAKQSPYGLDSFEPVYRTCMRSKGWKRVEVSMAESNQFRGPESIEDFMRPPAPLSGKRYMQQEKR
jgi:hypothetical protein